jgi:hypothetical protein
MTTKREEWRLNLDLAVDDRGYAAASMEIDHDTHPPGEVDEVCMGHWLHVERLSDDRYDEDDEVPSDPAVAAAWVYMVRVGEWHFNVGVGEDGKVLFCTVQDDPTTAAARSRLVRR